MPTKLLVLALAFALAYSLDTECPVTYDQLHTALTAAQKEENGGFGFNMWGTVVNRDGKVCCVAFTGQDRGDQWPGSRAISAQKANTANAFCLPNFALSTANLYSAVQPGGSLFGLQFSNPVDPDVAYKGPSTNYGKKNDPMVGLKIGGVNVFGGGLGLYDEDNQLVGGVGVSGDSSCADHNIAWRVRHALNLDYVPAKGGVCVPGVVGASIPCPGPDSIIYDITSGVSASGWGHPACTSTIEETIATLPDTQ